MTEHRFATATAVLTFVLLLAGGMVHSTGSALACPDWPRCWGTFAPPMVGGVFYEYGHRLLGTAVGLATIGLAILVWRRRRQSPALRAVTVALVPLVGLQGWLGRVIVLHRLPPPVSIAHFALSMVIFASFIAVAVATRPRGEASVAALPPGARRLGALALGLVYAQMVLGAAVRHLGVSLVCVDFPLCRGSLWPAGAAPIVYVHVLHRFGAAAVALGVGAAAVCIWRGAAGPARRTLRALALGGGVLVAAQIGLGILSLKTFLGLGAVMGHLAAGTALFATFVSIVLLAAPARMPATRRLEATATAAEAS